MPHSAGEVSGAVQVSDGLRSCLMTGAGVGMMLVLCPKLAGVGLAVVPPASVLAVLMGRRVKAISKELQVATSQNLSGR